MARSLLLLVAALLVLVVAPRRVEGQATTTFSTGWLQATAAQEGTAGGTGWTSRNNIVGNNTGTSASCGTRGPSEELCGLAYNLTGAIGSAPTTSAVSGLAVRFAYSATSGGDCREDDLMIRLDVAGTGLPRSANRANATVLASAGTVYTRERGGAGDLWGLSTNLTLADLLSGSSGAGPCIRVEKNSGTGPTPTHRIYLMWMQVFYDVVATTTSTTTTTTTSGSSSSAGGTSTTTTTTTAASSTSASSSAPPGEASEDTGGGGGDDFPIGLVAGIAGGALCLIVLIIIAVVVVKKRKDDGGSQKELSLTSEEETLSESSAEEYAVQRRKSKRLKKKQVEKSESKDDDDGNVEIYAAMPTGVMESAGEETPTYADMSSFKSVPDSPDPAEGQYASVSEFKRRTIREEKSSDDGSSSSESLSYDA